MRSVFNFKKFFSIILAVLMIAQTMSMGVHALNVRAGNFRPQVLVNTTAESTMLGFGGDVSQTFLDNLGELIGEDMDLTGLVGFNGLMIDGGVSESALRGISRSLIPPRRRRQETSRLSPERQALVAMSQIVSQGKMTATALRSIKDMFDDGLISPVGLTRLASLYKQNNIHYIIIIEDTKKDSEENIGDGIARKYASTRFPGCEENDIIVGERVWAACNSSYPWDGINNVSHLDTYNDNGIDARDENGWKYGALYPLDFGSCPQGYTLMSFSDSQRKGLPFFKELKMPLGGLMLLGQYYDINRDSQNNIRYQQQGVVGTYMVKENFKRYFITYGDGISFSNGNDFGTNRRVSLRCERVVGATDEELQKSEYTKLYEKRCEEDKHTISRYDSNGEQSGPVSTCTRGCNDEPICLNQEEIDEREEAEQTSTQDEYIQSKVAEINQCHIDLYNSQLEKLEDTIDDFQESVRDAHSRDNDSKALKYIKAISKLEEIRSIITNKYRSVFGIE